ncbi:MAG: cobyrinate a,c-diamide synthase [Synechococcus sp.]
MAIAIAAPASGSGKTTITLALLTALKNRGLQVQSFKVGPDYIDPMFHQAATGLPCRNLDPFLTSEDYVRYCFVHHCRHKQAAVVEGVMGLFDGKTDGGEYASTAHVAKLLDLPVVLILDAQKVGRTVAAIAYGLTHFDPNLRVAGVIFNRVGSDRHAYLLQEAIASINLPVLGTVRTTPDIHLPSRHLGLIPAEEQDNFPHLLDRLAHLADTSFNWEQLAPLLEVPQQVTVPAGDTHLWPQPPPLPRSPIIGIARDAAFNFHYADNLDLLEHFGARLEYFSPLQSGFNPCSQFDGLYLGGGFPEVFAAELSQQLSRQTVPPGGIPITYAECGGLMVLGQNLIDRYEKTHSMVGWFPYSTTMSRKLTLGYRSARVMTSTPAVHCGESIRGHEFHHSTCQPQTSARSGIYEWGQTREGWSSDRIHASYLHLHWGAQPQVARRWLQSCAQHSLTRQLGV